jgi:hypothetical protein
MVPRQLHQAFKFQWPILKTVNLKEIINHVIRHPKAFLQSTGNQLRPDPCACAKKTAKWRGTYAAMHKHYQHNFPANKQKHDAQTDKRGRSAARPWSDTII